MGTFKALKFQFQRFFVILISGIFLVISSYLRCESNSGLGFWGITIKLLCICSGKLFIQGVPKQADIFKSLIWDFLMIINYHSKFHFGEEDITFDILVDLMTLFQWGILKFTISKISKNQIFLWNFHKYCKGNSKMSK